MTRNMRVTTLMLLMLAVACADGHRDLSGAGNQDSPPRPGGPQDPGSQADAGQTGTNPTTDAGTSSIPDGSVAVAPEVDQDALAKVQKKLESAKVRLAKEQTETK